MSEEIERLLEERARELSKRLEEFKRKPYLCLSPGS